MSLGIGIGITPTLGQGVGVSSLSSLFLPGDVGGYLDAIVADRLWQTYVGAAHPAADGDPVGLLIDQLNFPNAAAFAAKPELVSNGQFASDLTGWTEGTALTTTWASGRAESARNGSISSSAGFRQAIAIANGLTYKAAYTIANTAAGRNFTNLSGLGSASKNVGRHLETGAASSTTTGLNFWPNANLTTTYLDDISLREHQANLIEQLVAGSRLTFKTDGDRNWIEGDGSADFLHTDIVPTAEMTLLFALRFPAAVESGQIVGAPGVGIRLGTAGEPAITWGSYDAIQSTSDLREEDIVLGIVGSASNVQFWIDGQMFAEVPGSYSVSSAVPLVLLARSISGTPNTYDRFSGARIYGFGIWDRALDADEVERGMTVLRQSFNPGAGVAPGLAPLSGVNLAGAEFETPSWPDVLDVDYFAGKGA